MRLMIIGWCVLLIFILLAVILSEKETFHD